MLFLHEARFQLKRLHHSLAQPVGFIFLSRPLDLETVAGGAFLRLEPESFIGATRLTARNAGIAKIFGAPKDSDLARAVKYLSNPKCHLGGKKKKLHERSITLVSYMCAGHVARTVVWDKPQDIAAMIDAVRGKQDAHHTKRPLRAAQTTLRT